MAEAIVSIGVETLGRLLAEEVKFLSGVTDQVEEVSRELKRMHCFLRDADARGSKDETVRNWLREIKSLTYRVEDIVEAFAVEVAAKRGRGAKKALTRFACIFCEGRSLHNLGLEITKVKNDISNLTTSLQSYNIRAISEAEGSGATINENHKWARQTYAHEVGEYFVGMEQDIRELVSLVVDGSKDRAIISIWGMGGLGKTTIARKIYKHRDVQCCFKRFAWVCITQQAQIRGILRDVLTQLCPDKKGEIKDMEDRELVEQLYRVQTETKCLVVLDDLWYMQDWENLVHAFPIVEGGSKILLTTRTKEVAKIGFPYELKCLNEKESWDLLKVTAFSRKEIEGYDPRLKDVGVEMVRKCGGLPLAICVLGGILKDKNSLRDWQMVNKNIDSYLSTEKGSEGGSGGGAIARVLSLSYNDLPYHLKPCFLYLGNFREAENIDAEDLYFLWMAEGMVLSQHQRRGETLKEVAERYLDELMQRSMVQVQVDEFSILRRFSACRVHDMMRDFCLNKGREEEFIGVIDLRGVAEPPLDSFSPINSTAYRLVIHMKDHVESTPVNAYTVSEEDYYKQLRSLLFRINSYTPEVPQEINVNYLNSKSLRVLKFENQVPQEINVNYLNFKSLRVLKFENHRFGGRKLPTGLEKLIHLSFLGFTGGDLDEIPASIAKLPFLQTLDLKSTFVEKMPNNLGKMKRLRHLFLPYVLGVKEKLRLTGLTELETLYEYAFTTMEVADLHELGNLRSLTATVDDNESLSGVINYMMSMNGQNLQETELWIRGDVSFSPEQGYVLLVKILSCEKLNQLVLGVKMSRFPQYEEHFFQGLIKLTLLHNEIEEDPMEILEKLPQLRYLMLSVESYVGTDMICHELGFPQLRCLILKELRNLRSWRVDKGGMRNLSRLEIEKCSRLEMIPEGLKHVAGLKELTIEEMPRTFVDRIKLIDGGGREGEDVDKIRHVPSITIQ